MKIVELHFCLLLWCGAADGLKDLQVDLGQNVTIDCEINAGNKYWFLITPSHHLVFILRSFTSTTTDADYGDPTFKDRFSLQMNGSLLIQNITVNELGTYYCIIFDTNSNSLTNGTRLNNTQHTGEHSNQTKDKPNETMTPHHLQIIFIASGVLNFILVIAVTGFTVQHCKRTPKLQPQPPDFTARSSMQHQEASSAQYEEIELSSNRRVIQMNSTYALLQKPKPQRGGA